MLYLPSLVRLHTIFYQKKTLLIYLYKPRDRDARTRCVVVFLLLLLLRCVWLACSVIVVLLFIFRFYHPFVFGPPSTIVLLLYRFVFRCFHFCVRVCLCRLSFSSSFCLSAVYLPLFICANAFGLFLCMRAVQFFLVLHDNAEIISERSRHIVCKRPVCDFRMVFPFRLPSRLQFHSFDPLAQS